MSKSYREDLTGQRFGRLTVIEFVPADGKKSKWKCRCDCGNITIVRRGDLKKGKTTSCGCFRREMRIKENTIHNATNTRIYRIWQGMKQRCFYSDSMYFKHYGGRGITVCNEWKNDFKAFYDWAMSNGYDDTLTIDRIDSNGNYCPENCRWVDMKTQCRNRRSNTMVKYEGEKVSLAEASERSGVNRKTFKRHYLKDSKSNI